VGDYRTRPTNSLSHTRPADTRPQITGITTEIEGMGPGPDREQWEAMKSEAEQAVAAHNTAIDAFQEQLAALESELPQTPTPAAPKFDPEKHPLLRKAAEKQEPEKPVVFAAGDMCEAQWTDRAWYKAKIQSVLGSVSAPKYLVRFVEYDDTLTIDGSAVRPLPSKRKREPEPAAAPSPATPVTSTPHVISGPASVNPSAQAAKDAAASELLPRKVNRVPNKGQLKKSVGSWKDFQAKGVGKKLSKRESMFRTSTSEGSRGWNPQAHCYREHD
jgi:survival-of-motor-neuron-related-splicing factor 30